MPDDTMFETRLIAALGRYADLAPSMDDEAIAQIAIGKGRAGGAGWLAMLRSVIPGSFASTPGIRGAYLLVILALLLAAVVTAVAGRYFEDEPVRPIGGNGSIVYSFGGNNHEAVVSIRVGPDGSDGREIEASRCPAYSTDGSVLAWISYEESAYLVVAATDEAPSHRLLLVERPQQSVSYAVSPDGSHVAWINPIAAEPASTTGSRVELWVASLDGGGRRGAVASSLPGESYDFPVWSPDGGRIAFGIYRSESNPAEAQRSAIDVVAADGSDRRRLTDRPGPIGGGMSWSPDGRYLAYTAVADGPPAAAQGTDLFVVGADGTSDLALGSTPASEHDPAWAPDGAFIAYEASTEGGPDLVTTIPMAGNAPTGPPLAGPASDWFVWSPDGRQLLWQELTALEAEASRTTLHSVDPMFQQPSTTLQVVDGLIVCPPSWQRLAPRGDR